uniref:Putative secreted protein n=1 Tax=Anopheles triannulatus TaxID=58253 RepID=A0A2M4B7P0_9DIPT
MIVSSLSACGGVACCTLSIRACISHSGRPNLLRKVSIICSTDSGRMSRPWTASRAAPLRQRCSRRRFSSGR